MRFPKRDSGISKAVGKFSAGGMYMANKAQRQGLTVVITGASSGIGKGLAIQLAAEGANVVFAARRTEVIEELAEELGSNAVAVTADVSRAEDVGRLFNEAIHHFGKFDVWINNAGIGTYGSFTETPLEDLTRTIDVNLLGTMYGSHYALGHFKERGQGNLINVGSFGGKVAVPSGASYSASKFGIVGLSAGLYQEMELEKQENIHVCTVNPWITDTPWTVHAGNYSGHEIIVGPADAPEKVVETIIGLIDEPQENIDIGVKSKGMVAASNLAPGMTARATGKLLSEMLKKAPPAEHTSGSLHIPVEEGTGVSGNLRQQLKMKTEDEA